MSHTWRILTSVTCRLGGLPTINTINPHINSHHHRPLQSLTHTKRNGDTTARHLHQPSAASSCQNPVMHTADGFACAGSTAEAMSWSQKQRTRPVLKPCCGCNAAVRTARYRGQTKWLGVSGGLVQLLILACGRVASALRIKPHAPCERNKA